MIVLTSVSEKDASVVQAVRAGAIGYVMTNAETALLVPAIRSAAAVQVHLSPRAVARLIREMRSPPRHAPLTGGEQEVLREITLGRSNKEAVAE